MPHQDQLHTAIKVMLFVLHIIVTQYHKSMCMINMYIQDGSMLAVFFGKVGLFALEHMKLHSRLCFVFSKLSQVSLNTFLHDHNDVVISSLFFSQCILVSVGVMYCISQLTTYNYVYTSVHICVVSCMQLRMYACSYTAKFHGLYKHVK